MELSNKFSRLQPLATRHSSVHMKPNNRIEELRTARGWNQADLAKRARVSPSLISKLENQEQKLTTIHMEKFAKIFHVRPTDILARRLLEDSEIQTEISERGAEAWTPEPAGNDNKHGKNHDKPKKNTLNIDFKASMITALLDENPNRSAWVLRSQALNVDGYRPGDILIIDAEKKAKPGDIICAQLYNRGDANTVFRIYQPPYLIAATTKTNLREPRLIDPGRVKIMGTVTETIRFRNS